MDPTPIAYKRVPKTQWIALKTSGNTVFFYNSISKKSTWEIPQELEEFVMNAFAPPDDDQIQEKLKDQLEAKEMLISLITSQDLSPFGNWDIEKCKIQDGLEQIKLTDKEQRKIFDDFCKEKAQQVIKSRAENSSLIKDRFFAFLDDQNVSYQITWTEFQKRYKRHVEFMAIPVKERQGTFEEWATLTEQRSEAKKAELRQKLIMDFYQLLQDVPQDSLVQGWKKTKKELEKLDKDFYKKFKTLDDKAELFLEWKDKMGL